MVSKAEVGTAGEKMAQQYLTERGYEIIRKNYKTKFGEVDIVATKRGCLYLVEVKSRVGDNSGFPEEMINRKKLMRMSKAAMYIQNFFDHEGPVEVAAITVQFDSFDLDVASRINFYSGAEMA